MCNFKSNLVAWVDGELSSSEAETVEQHVAACSECRQRVSAYETISQDFAVYHSASVQPAAEGPSVQPIPRWVPLAVAAAAVILIAFLLLPRNATQPQSAPAPIANVVELQPAVAATTPPDPVKPVPSVARRRAVSHRAPQPAQAMTPEPTVRIAIPADAIYPPGAVPEGMAYFANVSFAADGSMQAFRLQR